VYFRKLKTAQSPFLRIRLPPTKDNQAMLELLDKHLKLGGFIYYTKPTKGNPSKVFWQSTKISMDKVYAIFEKYPFI
jgi:hypothetical protein